MTKWWQEGYEFAKSKNPVRYCHIPEQKKYIELKT
jgi:hypothetical protein